MFPIKVKLKLKLKLKLWPTKPFFLTLTCVFTANSEFIQPFLQTVTFYIQNWLLRDAIHYMKVQARTQDFFWGVGQARLLRIWIQIRNSSEKLNYMQTSRFFQK